MPSELPFSESLLLALVPGVGIAAGLSLLLVRQLRRRMFTLMRQRAMRETLARYAAWVALLHGPLAEEAEEAASADDPEATASAQALAEAGQLQARHFPQAEPEIARLRQADVALREFLRTQADLKQRHAEAWLESDHEARLARLCLRAETAAQALARAVGPTSDELSVIAG